MGVKSLNAPIEGAKVQIEKPYNNEYWVMYSDLTDSAGLAKVMSGQGEVYKITTTADGYETVIEKDVTLGTTTNLRTYIQMTEVGTSLYLASIRTDCQSEITAKTCYAQIPTSTVGLTLLIEIFGSNGYNTSGTITTAIGSYTLTVPYVLNDTTTPIAINYTINGVYVKTLYTTLTNIDVNITETNNGTITINPNIPKQSRKNYIIYGAILLILTLLIIAWGEHKKTGIGIILGTAFMWIIGINFMSIWTVIAFTVTIILIYGYAKKML